MNRIKYFGCAVILLLSVQNSVSQEARKEMHFLVVTSQNAELKSQPSPQAPRMTDVTLKADRDTLFIEGKTGNYFTVRFFSNSGQFQRGYIHEIFNAGRFSVGPVFSFFPDLEMEKQIERNIQRAELIQTHPEWSAVIRAAISNNYLYHGLTAGAVEASVGPPDSRDRFFFGGTSKENWNYNLSGNKSVTLEFVNGILEHSQGVVAKEVEAPPIISAASVSPYPYRKIGGQMMIAGAIIALSGYLTLEHHDGEYVRTAEGTRRRQERVKNGFNWFIIGAGLTAEIIGGILYNYVREENFSVVPLQDGLALRTEFHF